MVATDLAKVATDPLGARRRMDRLVAKRTRRHETVVAALKETALRSTVRLSTGPPIHVSIVFFYLCIFLFLLHSIRKRTFQHRLNTLFTHTNVIGIILAKFENGIIFLINT